MRLSTDRRQTDELRQSGPGGRSGGHGGPGLAGFNAAPPEETAAALLRCCGSPRWADRIAAHRPYPDLDSLLAAADEASYDMTGEELDEALAAESTQHVAAALGHGAHEHPEQPGLLAAHTALRAAHAVYESRFGHAFVICLDGYAPEERLDQVLAGIRTRLANEREQEREVTAEELRAVARTRLARLVRRHAAGGTRR